MKAVDLVSGRMAPLPRAQVDTDQIIPKQFLKRIERTGFGEFLFYDWARDDPGFVLNRPQYQDATVLVCGPDFGTGSSREHAPWALHDWGFRAVIAPSFGDIFRSNCHKVGLLAIELPEAVVETLLALAEDQPDAVVTVHLEDQTFTAPGIEESFEFDAYAKYMLLNGLDEIGATMLEEEAISEFEKSRPTFKPRTSN